MVNKAILIGNLGKDPELRMTQSQTAVASFSIATTEKRKDASGAWVDQTEWHNIVTFGNTATNCHKYLKKGSKVFIEGRIQNRKYQDKEGKDRYISEVVANNVQFLSTKSQSGDSGGYSAQADDAGYGSSFGDDSGPQSSANNSILASFKSADDVALSGSSAKVEKSVSFEDDDIPF